MNVHKTEALDRDALLQVLAGWFPNTHSASLPKLADQILTLVQPAAPCDDLRARLANIAALRDEMRTAGGSVIWIDDLDTILDGAKPGAALTSEELPTVRAALSVLRVRLSRYEADRPQLERVLALAKRLDEARP